MKTNRYTLFIFFIMNIFHILDAEEPQWDKRFTTNGLMGTVNTLDSSANYLYAGGYFILAGNGKTVNHIARWDGTEWKPVGEGFNQSVYDILVISDTEIYAAGDFTLSGGVSVNRIARWDGISWQPLGAGLNNCVRAIEKTGAYLYAAGFFTQAGSTPVNHIARWNGTSWSALGSGTNEAIYALETDGTNLFLGGDFTIAGGQSCSRIAKWNGSTFTALGSGLDGTVMALAYKSGILYIGGYFNHAGGNPAANIALWDGATYYDLAGGVNGTVSSLIIDGNNVLYAGGNFTDAGGVTVSNKARWNGSNWLNWGQYINSPVSAIGFYNNNPFIGGAFTIHTANTPCNAIAKWELTQWAPVGAEKSFNNIAFCVASSDTVAYFGGTFTKAGGITVNQIVKWDGQNFSPLGTGVNDAVYDLLLDSGNLYLAGNFTSCSGLPILRFARWDGALYHEVGSGSPNNPVNAIAKKGKDIYIGGIFTAIGAVPANYIAKWDGSSWTALGTGLNGIVYDICIDDSNNVYAAGQFTHAGGVTVNNIAKWNGSSWSSLGTGTNDAVLAVAWFKNKLYIGGSFSMAGGVLGTNYLAAWNGTGWEPVAEFNASSYINTLTVGDTNTLFVGGSFNHINSNPDLHNIARFDGNAWYPLSSGLNNTVECISYHNRNLFAAGHFSSAGNTVSFYAGRFYYPPDRPVTIISQPVSISRCVGTSASFTVGADGTSPIRYQWRKNNFKIPGATQATYIRAVTSLGDSGLYWCEVMNALDTVYSDTVKLTMHPLPDIHLGPDQNICLNDTARFDAGAGYILYQWSPSLSTGQYLNTMNSGTVKVTVTDIYSCTGQDSAMVTIQTPYPDEEICIVTIDPSTDKNMIVWEKTPHKKTKHFNIYRESTIMGVYNKIGQVEWDSVSVFVDMTSIPKQQQYLYKITVTDSCDNESDINTSPYHKTMLLQYAGSVGGINLSWNNKYEINGTPYNFMSYIIYRGTDSTGLVPYDTVSGSLFAYIDIDPQAQLQRMYYRIGGLKAVQCAPNGKLKANAGPFSQAISNLEDNRLQATGATGNRYNHRYFSVFPNPAKQTVTLRFSTTDHQAYILIRDLTGRTVSRFQYNGLIAGPQQIEINLIESGLEQGIYFITLYTEMKEFTEKIILTY